jgi:energy-converting hydrogenase Eha subunit C
MPSLGLVASIVAIIAGIIILIWPHIINYIIAFYLLIIGIVGVVNYFH